jgi:cystathionine beta-lyase
LAPAPALRNTLSFTLYLKLVSIVPVLRGGITAQNFMNFDTPIDRRNTSSTKWDRYKGRDIIPLWVADMDFAAPDFILDALHKRVDHGVLGYTKPPPGLSEAFLQWLETEYGWQVRDTDLSWLPGVVPGLNLAARALARPQGSILVPTPVYYPFLDLAENANQRPSHVPLIRDSATGHWIMDFDALDDAVDPSTTMIMISNPQNPTGRVYSRQELTQLADFATRHDLVIVSDEIHCQLVLDTDAQHIPIASLSPEVADRTITLFAATKTYNVAGLSCAVAVISNASLKRKFDAADPGLLAGIGPLAFTASEAAYRDHSGWVDALLGYLRNNHAKVLEVAGNRMNPVQATYLAWIDVSDLKLANPARHFEKHGLGLSLGRQFGQDGFVRLNFGTQRSVLEEGLTRFARALEG